ncbi:MAG: Cof-type HAD-IIB family hydrolase, partial [Chloroflexota bacterium]
MTQQMTLDQDIKLIVLDVDHTLLNNKSELSERNKQAIAKAKEKGVKVMLATGKAYGSCKHIISDLKLDTPGIFTQGLTIHESSGALRHEQTLDDEVARRVITFAEDRGYAVVGYAQGRILARSSNPYIEELHTRWKEVKPEYIGPLQNSLGSIRFNKLVLVSAGDTKKIKALRWQLSTQLNGSARLISGGVPHMLEVMPPNASKGNALRALLKELKVDPKNVLAIGDAENDVEMIQLAGVGVAVANAEKTLKDAADDTTASNEMDGVALAIEKYVIGEQKAAEEASTTTETTTGESPLEANAATAPKPEDADEAKVESTAD